MTQELVSSKYLTVDYETPTEIEGNRQSAPEEAIEAPMKNQRKLPTGIFVVCGFFVLISMLGMYSAVNSMTKLYLVQPESADLVGLGNDSRARQMKREIREMEARAAEAKAKYLPFLTYNELLKFGLSVGFAISVGLLLIRHPNARKIAVTACYVALFYHLSATTITCMSTSETLGPMDNLLKLSASQSDEYRALSSQQKADAQQDISRVLTGGFMIVIGIYLISKLAFYGSCVLYLGRQEIRDLYAIPATETELPVDTCPESAIQTT